MDNTTTNQVDPSGSIDAIHSVVKLLIENLQMAILSIGGGIVVLCVIIAGFHYITGNAKQGKTAITAAVIGTAIMIFSYAIISFVCQANGSSC